MTKLEIGNHIKFGDRQGVVVGLYENGFHLNENGIINMVMYDQAENIEFLD